MKRSDFIKSSCIACSAMALPATLALLLESCQSLNMIKVDYDKSAKQCIVPLEKFKETNLLLMRIKGFEFDFVIFKKSETEYNTIELKCSHEDQPLDFSSKNIFCSAHGSIFNFEGIPLKQPASKPLNMFISTIIDNQLIIKLKK